MKNTIKLVSVLFLALMLIGCSTQPAAPAATQAPAATDAPAATAEQAPAANTEAAPPFTELVLYTDGTPGSSGDKYIRTLGPIMEEQAGITVTYENISGGSGTNVLTEMMNATKTTNCVAHSCSLALSWLTDTTGAYNQEDISVVTSICIDYNVLLTAPDSQFSSWDELVAYAKEHPGEVTWGGTGTKGSQQLLHQLIMDELGIDIEYIPYDSAANVKVGVLAGDITIGSCAVGNVLNDIADGVYKGLLVTSPERFDVTPDLPTAKDVGLTSVDGNGVWRAFYCNSEYDDAAIEYMAELITNAKASPAWEEFLTANNQIRWDLSHEEIVAYVAQYLEQCKVAIANME